VTSGYWNNSLLTYRSRLAGYFLTGDLAYKDEDGRFFHVDRVPDLIRTKQGPVYGLQIEEYLLSRFPAIADCTVYGKTLQESEFQVPSIRVRLRPGTDLNAMEEREVLQIFNQALLDKSLPVLSELEFSSANQVPLGTTGKVLKRELRLTGAAV
jgi:acyl-coenzyme A synthetase/AMP-(fatty) acid ligase